jgi:hypothetical protein
MDPVGPTGHCLWSADIGGDRYQPLSSAYGPRSQRSDPALRARSVHKVLSWREAAVSLGLTESRSAVNDSQYRSATRFKIPSPFSNQSLTFALLGTRAQPGHAMRLPLGPDVLSVFGPHSQRAQRPRTRAQCATPQRLNANRWRARQEHRRMPWTSHRLHTPALRASQPLTRLVESVHRADDPLDAQTTKAYNPARRDLVT